MRVRESSDHGCLILSDSYMLSIVMYTGSEESEIIIMEHCPLGMEFL